jgi:hypothetical protein
MTGPSWDILIATVPHRHGKLRELLADLGGQIRDCQAGGCVGALLYRDNLTVSYGAKTRVLLEASTADYVSCVDDDDLLAPGAVARILGALESRPDYVGFAVAWTRNGVPQLPVEHSLRHPRWSNGEDMLRRSVMQFNPIRRDLALLGTWEGGYEAEIRWGDGVVASGRCKTETWLPPPAVYLYRESEADTFKTARQAWSGPLPEIPACRWLTVLDAPGSC